MVGSSSPRCRVRSDGPSSVRRRPRSITRSTMGMRQVIIVQHGAPRREGLIGREEQGALAAVAVIDDVKDATSYRHFRPPVYSVSGWREIPRRSLGEKYFGGGNTAQALHGNVVARGFSRPVLPECAASRKPDSIRGSTRQRSRTHVLPRRSDCPWPWPRDRR